MLKMATGEGSPLCQGAGTGSREVFGGYSGTPDLSSYSMFLRYVDLYRRKKSVGGASRGPGDRGRSQGVGAPSYLLFPGLNSKSLGLYPFQNRAPEGFIPFGLRLIFLFFEILKQAINNNMGWASS